MLSKEGILTPNQFLVNVTSAVLHSHQHPVVIARAAYGLSKSAGRLFMQLLANQIQSEKLQILTFHPGAVWNKAWIETGITKDRFVFDEGR